MEMAVDGVLRVAANAVWVLGLSVLLAALSWAHWLARREEAGIRATLGRRGPRRAVDLGVLLFCAGLGANSRRWWERAVWGLLIALWMVRAALAGRKEGA